MADQSSKALSIRDACPSDGFLQFLGGAKRDLFGSLDLNFLAGRGIAALAGGALADLENAEADNPDTFALLEVLGDAGDHVGQNGLGRLLRQFVVFGQSCREMLQCNGGRSRCFLRPIWPSSLLMASEHEAYQALVDSGRHRSRCFACK